MLYHAKNSPVGARTYCIHSLVPLPFALSVTVPSAATSARCLRRNRQGIDTPGTRIEIAGQLAHERAPGTGPPPQPNHSPRCARTHARTKILALLCLPKCRVACRRIRHARTAPHHRQILRRIAVWRRHKAPACFHTLLASVASRALLFCAPRSATVHDSSRYGGGRRGPRAGSVGFRGARLPWTGKAKLNKTAPLRRGG
jgi:hypothetical protein